MHTGDGFLLVYSITDDQTFEELRSIREQILRVHPNRQGKLVFCLCFVCVNYVFVIFAVPMLLIGNKLDMAAKDRAVTKEEGGALAKEFNTSHLEVSVCLQSTVV